MKRCAVTAAGRRGSEKTGDMTCTLDLAKPRPVKHVEAGLVMIKTTGVFRRVIL